MHLIDNSLIKQELLDTKLVMAMSNRSSNNRKAIQYLVFRKKEKQNKIQNLIGKFFELVSPAE